MAKLAEPELRIIWAVDPFPRSAEIQRNSALAIQALSQRQAASIEPVYVSTDPRHQVPPKLRGQYCRELAAEAQSAIDEWTSGMRLRGLRPIKVLGPASSSTRESVHCLLDYAKSETADLIVASTRARRGPSRWFLGSFVETLSLISDVPLLVINPLWNPVTKPGRRLLGKRVLRKPSRAATSGQIHFERILFPTDFSDESHQALLHLIPFAQKMKSRIVLFHKVSMGLAVMPEATIATIEASEEARHEEYEASERFTESWSRELRRAGLQVETLIDDSPGASITGSILRAANQAPCMIALAGESTGLETHLLGSVTRQILRQSPHPVWVIHPPRTEEKWALPQTG